MIRSATQADEPRIRSCAEMAYARYVAAIGRRPAPMTADFARQIAAGQVFVATGAGDRVQGYIVFHEEAGHMLLENVAVFPDAAGQGIGGALIRFCEDTARAKGLHAVHLYTNEKMRENLSLYPRLGYVEVARRVEDGFARVYFEKTLT